MSKPEFQTARLRLRPLQPSDRAALHQHWTQPEVRRYLWDDETLSPEEVQEVISTSERLFRERGVGLWSLRGLDSARLLGCAGYWPFHEPPQIELLFSITPEHWGKGLAGEAAQALMAYVFEALDWSYVQASVDAPNRASRRALKKLGMRRSGEVPGAFGSIEIYQIMREQWQKATGASPCA